MARTFGSLFFFSAANLEVSARGAAAGQFAITRNALGDVSLNNAAGVATVQFWADINSFKRPYIQFPTAIGMGTVPASNEFQETFGTAAGAAGNPYSGVAAGSPTSINQPASQFGTALVPWGLALIDVFAVYSVATVGLTTATLGVNRATFQENGAFTNTAVLAATGVALTTTTSASTPHVQKVSLAQPLAFETADYSNISIEFLVTTAATSAVRVYGLGFHCAIEAS